MEKWSFLMEAGVGEAAKGYNLGSKSSRCRGARSIRGGNLVVVVVVVVTTVVCVAGPYENWPSVSSARVLLSLDTPTLSSISSPLAGLCPWVVSDSSCAPDVLFNTDLPLTARFMIDVALPQVSGTVNF